MDKKIGDINKKIPDISALVTTTVLNTKISEVENKILDTRGLVITTVDNTKIGEAKNKILDVSGLAKKTYNAKLSDILKKYLATFNYNEVTKEKLAAKVNVSNISNISNIF